MEYVNKRSYEKLIEHDQLVKSINQGLAFPEFLEPPIHFPPTFKFEPGIERKYSKKRVPSYCDRVLWRSLKGSLGTVEWLDGGYVDDIVSSDHRPVWHSFRVEVQTEQEPSLDPLKEVSIIHLQHLFIQMKESSTIKNVKVTFVGSFINQPCTISLSNPLVNK
jgi:phosphatidylinositol-bisphosphatase